MSIQIANIQKCLDTLEPSMTPEEREQISLVFVNLEKYLNTVFSVRQADRRGTDLSDALGSALNISTSLLRTIDSGITGLDDQLFEEFERIKVKYLGA